LVLHLAAGTHATREILTTGAAGSAATALRFTAGALVGAEPPALPVAGVPPAPAALAPALASPRRHSAAAANAAARDPDRLWARVFANVFSSARSEISNLRRSAVCPARRDATLSV
jgi:hypothetical protein